MNIDVTATDGDRTWSEKFSEAVEVKTSGDGVLTIVGDDEVLYLDPGAGTEYGDPVILAEFAPGAWHSWRRTD